MAKKVIVVGGGISGLIAAHVLEQNGFSTILVDKSENLGGRLQTTLTGDAPLDHGFQVLLTAYPKVRQYLDLTELELQYFKPGAIIFSEGLKTKIGDPLRDFSALWSTITSSVGSFSDKWKVFLLSQRLKRKSVKAIFTPTHPITTWDYLEKEGFSQKMIQRFFHPFFSGIFLETDLHTPSPMFEFVFKMFAEGHAAIPKRGIHEIVCQLKSELHSAEFLLGKEVDSMETNSVTLSSGEVLSADAVISTIDLSNDVVWKSCENLYFELEKGELSNGVIGLIPEDGQLINNIHRLWEKSLNGRPIISVTVVKKHKLSSAHLESQIRKELQTYCQLEVGAMIEYFKIPKALPEINFLKAPVSVVSLKTENGIYQAGDVGYYGSLNAAMESGELAAMEVVKDLTYS